MLSRLSNWANARRKLVWLMFFLLVVAVLVVVLAVVLGATDEGPPGPRGTRGFYAGYFRDLDGNKLNVFISG